MTDHPAETPAADVPEGHAAEPTEDPRPTEDPAPTEQSWLPPEGHADEPTERDAGQTEPPFEQPAPGWFFYDGINAEYQAAVASFPLPVPEGFAFPEAYPDPGEPAIFGEGAGNVHAYLLWQDAVHAAAVDAHRAGDAQAAGYWVEVSASFEQTPVYQAHIDHSAPNPWRDEWIPNARHGDFAALGEVVDAARVAK